MGSSVYCALRSTRREALYRLKHGTNGGGASRWQGLKHPQLILSSHWGVGVEQMFSFSLSSSSSRSGGDCDSLLLDHSTLSAEEPVSSSDSSNDSGDEGTDAHTNGDVAGFGGPFTSSQMVELQQQICIYRCIEAEVPIPFDLPILSARSIPRSSFSISSRVIRPRTSGARILQLGVIGDPDPEPGRCRRTDGKRWRCSKRAVANQKYCNRHLNRGRHHSRKLVEGQASRSARLVLSNAHSPTASYQYGAGSSNSLSIAQLPGESLHLSIPNFLPMQLNRMQMSEHYADILARNSQGLSMQGSELNSTNTSFPISTGPAPFAGSSSLPPLPDPVLASGGPVFNLPTRSFLETTSFLPSSQMNNEVQISIRALPNPPHAEYHGVPNASSELPSFSSSPFPENLTISPPNLSDDLVSMDVGQGVMNWDPVAWASSLGGPLGGMLANNINMPSEAMHNSLSSDIASREWGLSPRY